MNNIRNQIIPINDFYFESNTNYLTMRIEVYYNTSFSLIMDNKESFEDKMMQYEIREKEMLEEIIQLEEELRGLDNENNYLVDRKTVDNIN